jgi:hypothetical protein
MNGNFLPEILISSTRLQCFKPRGSWIWIIWLTQNESI